MFKKVFAIFLALCMIFAIAGCKRGDKDLSSGQGDFQLTASDDGTGLVVNPLTGIKDLAISAAFNRPVAVMVNNVGVAWDVQKGLTQADIVYETYVEGGITRLMAVYKDISTAGNIGTVRSARYVYADLAKGHDAIYVHCGLDPTYCKPRIAQLGLVDFDINTGKTAKYGFRVPNGKSSEHTMYTSGSKIVEGIKALNKNNQTSAKWVTFAAEGETVTLANRCDAISVPIYRGSSFTYDAASGKYLKNQGKSAHIDYNTNEQIAVKNVFVLFTDVSTYADKYHANVDLTGGKGYYVCNGTYTEIKWEKGNDGTSPLTFKNIDGSELKVNTGNSWVCIANKNLEEKVKITANETDAATAQ